MVASLLVFCFLKKETHLELYQWEFALTIERELLRTHRLLQVDEFATCVPMQINIAFADRLAIHRHHLHFDHVVAGRVLEMPVVL